MSVITLADLQAKLVKDEAETPDRGTFTAPSSTVELEGFEGEELTCEPRVFNSGKPGWYVSGNGTLHGIPVRVQVTVTIPKRLK